MTSIMTFVQNNLDSILAILGMILAWVVSRPWCKAKQAEAQTFIDAKNLGEVELLASSVVTRVYQDTVRSLKDTPKWDDEMKRRVFADALSILKAEVQEHGVSIAQAALPGLLQVAVNAMKQKE